jgi:hypothetical protein
LGGAARQHAGSDGSNKESAGTSDGIFAASPINAVDDGWLSMDDFLHSTLTDDGSLETPGTPQYEAFLSIQSRFPHLDPASGEEHQEHITTLYSLSVIYFSTNGEEWVNRSGWKSFFVPCLGEEIWFGVSCDTHSNKVTRLALDGNDLFGSIPSEIRGLTSLGTSIAIHFARFIAAF